MIVGQLPCMSLLQTELGTRTDSWLSAMLCLQTFRGQQPAKQRLIRLCWLAEVLVAMLQLHHCQLGPCPSAQVAQQYLLQGLVVGSDDRVNQPTCQLCLCRLVKVYRLQHAPHRFWLELKLL